MEGIDGAGKSTQLGLMQKYFREHSYTAIPLVEPTFGKYGRTVRSSLARAKPPSLEKQREMFTLDRREHVQQKIRPLLRFIKNNPSFLILQDRSYLSFAAYQALGESEEELLKLIASQEKFAPRPDVFVLLDHPVGAALARLGLRESSPTWTESQRLLSAARRRYRILARTGDRRILTIKAAGTADQVHNRILNALCLPKRGH